MQCWNLIFSYFQYDIAVRCQLAVPLISGVLNPQKSIDCQGASKDPPHLRKQANPRHFGSLEVFHKPLSLSGNKTTSVLCRWDSLVAKYQGKSKSSQQRDRGSCSLPTFSLVAERCQTLSWGFLVFFDLCQLCGALSTEPFSDTK